MHIEIKAGTGLHVKAGTKCTSSMTKCTWLRGKKVKTPCHSIKKAFAKLLLQLL